MPKYELTNRVNLPGAEGVQAVIVEVSESIPGFPVYALCWLTQKGELLSGTCGEGDLAIVNPTFADRQAESIARHRAEQAIERRVTALVAARLRARKQRKR